MKKYYETLFRKEIEKLTENYLFREIYNIDRGASKCLSINGKRCLNLASNNYLGLSFRKELIKKSAEAINEYGCSSSASRLVTGNYSLYDILEERTASFKGYDKCLIFNTEYIANLSVISSICNKEWIIFSDELNHASIIDGVRLSKAKHLIYKHNDTEHLEFLLKKYGIKSKKLIVTDTVFSMDGDIAKLIDIVNLSKRYNALLMVDEAHASGIFGKGRGIAHEMGVEKEIDINMGTFSKGFGSFGSYVCSSKIIIQYLINKARGFIFFNQPSPFCNCCKYCGIRCNCQKLLFGIRAKEKIK